MREQIICALAGIALGLTVTMAVLCAAGWYFGGPATSSNWLMMG